MVPNIFVLSGIRLEDSRNHRLNGLKQLIECYNLPIMLFFLPPPRAGLVTPGDRTCRLLSLYGRMYRWCQMCSQDAGELSEGMAVDQAGGGMVVGQGF
jgi:hypothetical protein